MLCAKNIITTELNCAFDVERDGGPWVCHACGSEAKYRCGPEVSAHFYHPAGGCGCAIVEKYGGGGESYEHLAMKRAIYEDAKQEQEVRGKIKEVGIEHPVGNAIADVAIIGTHRKVAVEIQLSSIPYEKIIGRMREHARNGFSTLWVVKGPDTIEEMRAAARDSAQYKCRAFFRHIHDLCRGALFIYHEKLKFYSVHLMGRIYVTYRHFKLSRRPYSLYELVDEHYNLAEGRTDVDYEYFLRPVVVPEGERWWRDFEDD
jgi:competence CoiA-like predicted nuclease